MSVNKQRDIGAQLVAVAGSASENSGVPSLITAGGTGDATKITGQAVECADALSGCFVVAGLASLAATKTLTLAIEIQESADNSTWDAAEVLQAATLAATGGGGGTDEYFVQKLDVDLGKRKKYVRFNVTPELDAASIDIAILVGVVLKNDNVYPAAA